MVEEGIRGGICHAILGYAKANNKYMKDYNKDEEESFLQYNDAKMFMDLQCQNHYQLNALNG